MLLSPKLLQFCGGPTVFSMDLTWTAIKRRLQVLQELQQGGPYWGVIGPLLLLRPRAIRLLLQPQLQVGTLTYLHNMPLDRGPLLFLPSWSCISAIAQKANAYS